MREWLLQDRALMRALRQRSPPFFQRLRLLMHQLREKDSHFIELHRDEDPLIKMLRKLIYKLSDDDPQFYKKLRSLMLKIRESENDPQLEAKLGFWIATIREQDPGLCEKLTTLMREIGNRDVFFIEKLRLRILTRIKRSLAAEPSDTTDIADLYEKAHAEGIDMEVEDYYYKEIYKRDKGGVRELPKVPWLELDLRLAVASNYDEKKKNGKANRTSPQKRTERQKNQSKP